MMAASSDGEGLWAAPGDPTMRGPAAGRHPARASPSTAAAATVHIECFIVVPLAVDVLTACRA
ncbi:hypothetical protein ABH924_001290 [Arthrobacter sp. GAS37]|uniref:hypothetical protein n=1 Tax=Arthrobacter sp. GAS37 TaxID=3156261 RepID=UPI003839A0AA